MNTETNAAPAAPKKAPRKPRPGEIAAKKAKAAKAKKKRPAPKVKKTKRDRRKKLKIRPAAVVFTERLDIRLSKSAKAKLTAKAAKARRTITSVVMELIEKMR